MYFQKLPGLVKWPKSKKRKSGRVLWEPHRRHSRRKRRKKKTCISGTEQWHVMFNKIVNINRIITKFTTVVPYTCMIMCTHFGKKLTAFAEVILINQMDPSSRTRAWLTAVLDLWCLWHICFVYAALVTHNRSKDYKCNKVSKYLRREGHLWLTSVRVSVVDLIEAAIYFPLVLRRPYCLHVEHNTLY